MRNVPERTLLKQELVDAVIEAIESLPKKDREVIRAHIDGLSHSEIGERLGISMQASKDRLYRARKRIKARVKELLSTVIGLPNTLPLKKIISGGITAMKLGTSTKVSIGVIGAVISGLIGFQVVTHNKTQQKVKPNEKVAQQTPRFKPQPKTVRKNSDKSKSVIQDEQYSDEEIEEALAWLDSLEEESSTEPVSSDETPEEEELTYEEKLRQRYLRIKETPEWRRINDRSNQLRREYDEICEKRSVLADKYLKLGCLNSNSEECRRLQQQRRELKAQSKANEQERHTLFQWRLDLLNMTREEYYIAIGRTPPPNKEKMRERKLEQVRRQMRK